MLPSRQITGLNQQDSAVEWHGPGASGGDVVLQIARRRMRAPFSRHSHPRLPRHGDYWMVWTSDATPADGAWLPHSQTKHRDGDLLNRSGSDRDATTTWDFLVGRAGEVPSVVIDGRLARSPAPPSPHRSETRYIDMHARTAAGSRCALRRFARGDGRRVAELLGGESKRARWSVPDTAGSGSEGTRHAVGRWVGRR